MKTKKKKWYFVYLFAEARSDGALGLVQGGPWAREATAAGRCLDAVRLFLQAGHDDFAARMFVLGPVVDWQAQLQQSLQLQEQLACRPLQGPTCGPVTGRHLGVFKVRPCRGGAVIVSER